MHFFGTIIQHAAAGFSKIKDQKSKYPDTTLLRTFVNLLKVQQDQLNGLSQKHLSFYYESILKQAKNPAKPDSAFLCAGVARPTATFTLPAGTQFNGGTDALKNPIIFSTAEAVNLNPAAIVKGYTLSQVPDPANSLNTNLCLQAIPAAGILNKDNNGKLLSWATFGGQQATAIQPAFAFASPMLFLPEGTRTITLTLNFASAVSSGLLDNVNYYLSTQKAWQAVTGTVGTPATPLSPVNSLSVNISLQPTDPPVVAFQPNPDGLTVQWPMLKIEFDSFSQLVEPPVLSSLSISVNVSGVQTFQLYNDYGLLSTKNPYPPFGPVPVVGNSFIIGNNEIFSKPLNSLVLELTWSKLPTNFAEYYIQYNNYLEPPVTCSNWALVRYLKKKTSKISPPLPPPPQPHQLYDNRAFTVNFSLLDNGIWGDFNVGKLIPNPDAADAVKYIPYTPASPSCTNVILFSEDDKQQITDTSFFGYPPTQLAAYPCSAVTNTGADPTIQNTALKYADDSKCGFMRMTLSDPYYGFGPSLYANVVTSIALRNAQIIIDGGQLLSPPNPPFTPNLTGITATYTACCQYDFTSAPGYPIQCYQYTPFSNYAVYDSTAQGQPYCYAPGNNPTSTGSTPGVALWPTYNYNGYLFLGIQGMLPADAMNLYFELARNYTTGAAGDAQADYYYINNSGWAKLPVLADGTNKFSCSGIVKVSVPGDIAGGDQIMQDKNYWFCIAVKNNPASSFSQTVFYNTNGFTVQRTSSIADAGSTVPQIAASTIA